MSKFVSALSVVVLGSVTACGGSDTTAPNPAHIPDFVYVSNQNGSDQLFTYSNGVATLLLGSVSGDADPQSAHGRIVFTGVRNGPTNSDIYSVKNDGSDLQRLTDTAARDFKPTLSPDGAHIVFASLRSGTSHLYIMNADGTNQTDLSTGANAYTPETNPRYSPSGTLILFSSPRTGTSQLFTVPIAGGTATQVTHEGNGAFDGSWSADGASIFYVDGLDHTKIHKLELSSGTVSDYVTGGVDVGQPACNATLCLVVSGSTSSNGDIYSYVGVNAHSPLKVVGTGGDERQPAILAP